MTRRTLPGAAAARSIAPLAPSPGRSPRLLEQRHLYRVGERLHACLRRSKVIAPVQGGQQAFPVPGVAHDGVEIDERVEYATAANPGVFTSFRCRRCSGDAE